jgi:A/G-specific adenine glycosylase
VLRLWSGLGYYARGRNLHAASRRVALDLKGKFPDTALDIETLPGVGRSTAAAIAAFAFGERAAILDGNVKRVLARCYAIPDEKNLWQKAEQLLPRRNIETYTQALMDLGATVCVRARPRCEACPVRAGCVARQTERIAEFPAPRARPVLPTRKATWYVLRHAGRVLLEKRPGAGLWGGLWTFPESLDGVRVGKKERLKPLEHGFTHFRLRVQPMLCEVARIPARAESPGRRWLELGEARAAAVPTPVRRILTSLAAR